MKYFLLIIVLFSINTFASNVITCGESSNLNGEAKAVLHNRAQKRAQKEIEEFVEKKVNSPYGTKSAFVDNTPEKMALLIEVYWCETTMTPLHSAYYNYYSRNKSVFE